MNKFIDENTGYIKKGYLMNTFIKAKLVYLADKSFSRITGNSIEEEMIIDCEKGLSVVRSSSSLYLYNRKEDRVYWKLPYYFKFSYGNCGGKIIANFDTNTKKLRLFGVCKKTNYFDLLNEIDFQDRRLPQEVLKDINIKSYKEDRCRQDPLRMIHFSYLEKQGEYLVALIAETHPPKKPSKTMISINVSTVQTKKQWKNKCRTRPQYLILFKLNKNLEIVSSEAHQYCMDRAIKISVSKKKIAVLSSIYGKNRNLSKHEDYELKFYDLKNLKRKHISKGLIDKPFRINVESPKISGSFSKILSFSFTEPDLIVIEIEKTPFYSKDFSIQK